MTDHVAKQATSANGSTDRFRPDDLAARLANRWILSVAKLSVAKSSTQSPIPFGPQNSVSTTES